jgi:hypothetical protein
MLSKRYRARKEANWAKAPGANSRAMTSEKAMFPTPAAI